MDAEGRTLAPGEEWELEEFVFSRGPDREALLAAVGDRIAMHHPPLRTKAPPSGWCSWYCFGPQGDGGRTSCDNLDVDRPATSPASATSRSTTATSRRWATGWRRAAAFGGNVQGVLKEIRDARLRARDLGRAVRRGEGFARLPRAPRLVREGRRGPAAALGRGDLRRLAARAVVRARRHASRGAGPPRVPLPHDAHGLGLHLLQARRQLLGGDARRTVPRPAAPRASRPTAAGMEAVRRGAGDAFILGCNHPLWPSLGLIARLAQLERHQAHVGDASHGPRARTSSATGRTAGCGGTTPTPSS